MERGTGIKAWQAGRARAGLMFRANGGSCSCNKPLGRYFNRHDNISYIRDELLDRSQGIWYDLGRVFPFFNASMRHRQHPERLLDLDNNAWHGLLPADYGDAMRRISERWADDLAEDRTRYQVFATTEDMYAVQKTHDQYLMWLADVLKRAAGLDTRNNRLGSTAQGNDWDQQWLFTRPMAGFACQCASEMHSMTDDWVKHWDRVLVRERLATSGRSGSPTPFQ